MLQIKSLHYSALWNLDYCGELRVHVVQNSLHPNCPIRIARLNIQPMRLDLALSDKIDTALRERLKYEFRLRGYNFSSIALELGVSFGAISSCASGAMKSQAAVARKLGKDPAEIWPDRFRQPEEKNSTKSRKEGPDPET